MKQFIIFVLCMGSLLAATAQDIEQGKKLLYYERYQTAEKEFKALLNREPANAEAQYGLVQAYLAQDKTAEATNSLLHLPSAINSDPYYQVAYGYLLLKLGKSDSAAIYFNEALDRTKQKDANILAAVAAAHINTEKGKVDYALDLLNKAIKRDKHNAALYVLAGDAYKKLQNGSEAYNSYKTAFEEDKSYAAAYHRMGELFAAQKNPELYLQYFNQAIAADPDYAPSYYRLYLHYFYKEPSKALDYYTRYAAKTDPLPDKAYDLADLYYINKQYGKAIEQARSIVSSKDPSVKPRIYKLLAYSYADSKDSAQAIGWMRQYFANENDSNFVVKDFDLMADLFVANDHQDSAMIYLAQAADHTEDSVAQREYFKKLAGFAAAAKDYASQAKWLGKYYSGNEKANNLDLFNWGLAHFRAEDYVMADSVFGLYVAKYPEQSFGYYWQARSNAMLDKEMENGLAVPYYEKLVEMLQKDTANANYKTWLSQAYGYLAAYEANTKKHYAEAISYFEKVLEVDPANTSAKEYIEVLEKRIAGDENKGSK